MTFCDYRHVQNSVGESNIGRHKMADELTTFEVLISSFAKVTCGFLQATSYPRLNCRSLATLKKQLFFDADHQTDVMPNALQAVDVNALVN